MTAAPPGLYRRSVDVMIDLVKVWPVYGATEAEWKVHFASVAPNKKFEEVSRRRSAVAVSEAEQNRLCRYCWMPICICADVPNLASQLQGACAPVMIFHAEEWLRRSNSGHIAAMLFDAPIIIEGLPEHLPLIATFGSVHPNEFDAAIRRNLGESSGAIAAAIPDNTSAAALAGAVLFPATNAKPAAEIATTSATAGKALVLGLLDGTWNQGNGMNRRVPASVDRMVIDIAPTYDSLFAPLREQTRSTGVSTLEATVMAVVEVLQALKRDADAASVRQRCITVMKQFVDVVRMQKHFDPAYPDVSSELVARLSPQFYQYCDQNSKLANLRTAASSAAADAARGSTPLPAHLAYSPVLNYCYCCAAYIGWSRMELHTRGDRHRRMFYRPESLGWEPSEGSRLNLKRPARASRDDLERCRREHSHDDSASDSERDEVGLPLGTHA
jgi:DTW domain-containing protein YfiP